MKIAMAQLNVAAGRIQDNVRRMQEMVRDAKAQHCDLIVFPEMSVTGYILQDRWLSHTFCDEMDQINDAIRSWSDGIGIIWGNIVTRPIEKANVNRDGRPFRGNAALFAYQGEYVARQDGLNAGVHLKHCMPDYRFFDDSRFFMSGVEVARLNDWNEESMLTPFRLNLNGKQVSIGLEVCEDLWSADYAIDPTARYIEQGVDLIVNISSSPWTLRKELSRERRMAEHVAHHGSAMVPLIYVNVCGMQNSGKNVLLFDGDSTCYGVDGKPMVSCNDRFTEELCIFTIGEKRDVLATEDKLLEALLAGIREFDRQMFQSNVKWIIGLSGGLDSTINATLLTMALGSQRIVGYNMASRYNGTEMISIAKNLASKLQIAYHEGNIEELVSATANTVDRFGYPDKVVGLVHENVQARLRGHLLSTFAAIEGGVIINNGNKVELALGYATLYGDAIGALSTLGDLTKVQLFELAHTINRRLGQEIVPSQLLPTVQGDSILWEIAPSAELKDNQVDPMKWFYHDWLIRYLIEYPTHTVLDVMRLYMSGEWRTLDVAPWLIHYGLDRPEAFIADLEWVMNLWTKSVFKRIQFPPILTVSRGAFGNDFRESQLTSYRTPQYELLKQEILKEAPIV